MMSPDDAIDAESESPKAPEPPVWPYLLPLAGFLALTFLEGYLPVGPNWYPVGYAIKLVVVAILMWICRESWRDLTRPSLGSIALATLVGLLVTLAWVGLDGHYPTFPFLGTRQSFDPNTLGSGMKVLFIVVRMIGLVLIVPMIEELFYRSFLMRWIVDPDYRKIPIGRVTPLGLAATTLVFASSHPEWLPAVLTGLAWGCLVAHTKSVTACVISHAVANLALGVYVLTTGQWKYW
jgi:uncharacterized protein